MLLASQVSEPYLIIAKCEHDQEDMKSFQLQCLQPYGHLIFKQFVFNMISVWPEVNCYHRVILVTLAHFYFSSITSLTAE